MTGIPENWSAVFKNPDEEARRNAVASLKEVSDRSALKILDQALGDESWRVRKAAIEVFRAFPHPELSTRTLIQALSDSDNAGRRNGAMEALVAIGEDALPYLHESINHPDGDVRKFIIDILGAIGKPASVDPILGLAEDPLDNIRLAAVEALGAIGDGKAFNVLLELLSSTDVSLQFSVLHALGRIGKPIPMDSVRSLLEKKILRRALYDALGQTRSPETVEIIAEGLMDSTKSAKQAAVRALHKLAADPVLEDQVRQSVKKKLASASLKPFTEFLESGQLPTKRATITLLSLIGTPEAARILVAAMADDTVQPQIEESLARIRTASPDTFREVVAEEDARVSREVIRVLEEVSEAPVGPMDESQFEEVRDLVAGTSGLFYDRDLKYLVERRVQRRMETLGVKDYDRYFSLIKGREQAGDKERQKLINTLSTNETYFFREDFQLRAFRKEILLEIMEQKKRQGSRRIRIWSAGCSSGEEPYTIAIIIRETPGSDEFDFDIIGSDINEDMIAKAGEALYNPTSFRVTDDMYVERYFAADGPRFRLADEIKNMVDLDHTNLLSADKAAHLENLDIIFCRNVIIYFSAEAKQAAVEHFYKLLNPGGYLLLGHSESLMSVSNRFELVHLKHDLVYRKPLEGGSP